MGSKSELNNYVTATSSLFFLRLLPEGSEFKSNSLYFPSEYCQNHTKLYLYFRLLNYYFSMLKAYSTLGFFLVSAGTTAWSLESLFSVTYFKIWYFWCQLEKLPDFWWIYSQSCLVSHVWCQLWFFLVSYWTNVFRINSPLVFCLTFESLPIMCGILAEVLTLSQPWN